MNKMKNKLYSDDDSKQLYCDLPQASADVESPFEADCTKLIHSPSFRRLQGKIQLFPGKESDFFRNRLTHSLEVESIAQIITKQVNVYLKEKHMPYEINPFIIRFACLAHDLGHPPFGHNGEQTLNKKMQKFGGFEGNAQTLHILTKLEKGLINYAKTNISKRNGLNITYRSLAAIIKNCKPIILDENVKLMKGYYQDEEKDIVKELTKLYPLLKTKQTIECQIMDIADDISNAVHDLEDSLKGGFLNLMELFFPSDTINEDISTKLKEICPYKEVKNCIPEINYALNSIFEDSIMALDKEKNDTIATMKDFYSRLKETANNGFERSIFINSLRNSFIRGIKKIEEIENNIKFNKPAFITLQIPKEIWFQIMVLKQFHKKFAHNSPKTIMVEANGRIMIERIFDELTEHPELMPEDYKSIYDSHKESKKEMRCICDFIAGMTDFYCVEFYSRLFSNNTLSFYKPF
jgi:dGTPase